jgi:hypothetical protein
VALRPVWQMTDHELLAEADAINAAEDQAALSDPSTLMRHVMPLYRRRQHLRIIGENVAAVGRGECARLLITTPPQVGKTVTAVVGASFWWLANRPAHRVIIGSYGANLAVNRGKSVRKLVIEHGHRYGLMLERGSQSAAKWDLTTGGGCQSVGVGTGVTGNPGDIAVIDDPHKSRQEADSLRFRDRVSDWYSADIVSRLAPDAPVILIMTRWHPDDLAARVMAQEGREDDGGAWRVIHMPAISLGQTYTDRGGRVLHDPLRRPRGEPLPHPKIKPGDRDTAVRHWETKRLQSSVRDWHSLYMGDPQPSEGALLSRDLLRDRRCFQKDPPACDTAPVKSAVAVDPSGGGRDVAGVIGGYLGTDKKLYYTHDRSKAMGSDEWSRAACLLAVDIDADRIVAEKNYGGDMVGLAIRTAWDALRREEIDALGGEDSDRYATEARFAGLPPRIVLVTAKKNKLLRAEPVAQQWIENRVFTATYLPEMEEEWATWMPDQTESPGRIDAAVYLAMELLPPPPLAGGHGTPGPTGTLPTSGLGHLGR